MWTVMRVLLLLVVITVITGCATDEQKKAVDIYNKPEEIYVFSVPANSISREIKDSKADVLKGFPFVSHQPTMNFRGKFPPEFYSGIKYKWSAEYIKTADIWKLRYNRNYYDIIYVTPIWIGDFNIKEDDLIKNIALSYNIPDAQIDIIDNWVKSGGILWIESAIYISAYDYQLNKFNDARVDRIIQKLKGMTLFGNKMKVQVFQANRIDEFNTERFVKEVIPDKHAGTVQVGKMLIEQTDFIGIYLTLEGEPIIKSGNTVYASAVNHGKGKIITLAPFDFKNVHYDGEIFRFDLLSWALSR